ncbi:MAG: cohesin domain-containing protein [Alistipes sp.]|nr:cohesin domain-containing protein [Alistipes sp.]
MKKTISKGIAAVLILMMIFALPQKIYAAGEVNVLISGGETTVGGEVEVTITLDNSTETLALADLWITYDAAVLEAVSGYDQGGGGKIHILSFSGESTYKVKFKGLTAGSSNVTLVSEQSIVSSTVTDQMQMYVSSGNVTVKGAATQSKNNNLSALTVSPGTLTPAFSKDVTTYNITLTESCARLTVSATPEDAKAKVSVWGAVMDPGDNTTKITVTAENGEQKVYTIYTKVPVTEKPKEEEKDIIVDVDGAMYKIISNFEEELLPEGYEAADYTYKNKKIVVGKGLTNGNIIFCVSDASIEKADPLFVVYDEQSGKFAHLKLVTAKGLSYTVVEDVDAMNSVEIPAGYVESEYIINNQLYKVWVEESNPAAGYFIIYCINVNGDAGWYQYDIAEGTMQRAFLNGNAVSPAEKPVIEETQPQPTEEAEKTPNEYKQLEDEHNNYVKKTRIALGMMAVLLVMVVIIVVIFTVKTFHDSHDDEYDEEEEQEEEPKRRKKKKDDDDFTFIG